MSIHPAALLTDQYELTMLDAAVGDGTADLPARFSLFARSLPAGHAYGQLAGLGRLAEMIEGFCFDPDTIGWLVDSGIIGPSTAERLDGWRFTGDVDAYREGELYMPGSPVLVVSAPFGDGLLLETLLLSVLNHDTAVMSKAARIVDAAAGIPVLEMGSRRTHEAAAVAAGRAAYLAGFSATSNLAAGRHYGVPTFGTAAHAWTLAHPSTDGPAAAGERAAFDAQIRTQGVSTALLIDTFDIADGVRTAVAAARAAGAAGPGAVRIDSGDLVVESRRVRALLDELGATETRIVVSGDLDEFEVSRLVAADAPVDSLGVGTRVVAGLTPPGFVYKLVELTVDGVVTAVSKRSTRKASPHGRRHAWRSLDADGYIDGELLTADPAAPDTTSTSLQVPWVRGGELVHRPSLTEVRSHAAAVRGQLRPGARVNATDVPAFEVTDLAAVHPTAAHPVRGPLPVTTAQGA